MGAFTLLAETQTKTYVLICFIRVYYTHALMQKLFLVLKMISMCHIYANQGQTAHHISIG